MEQVRKNLKIASIINIIIGTLTFPALYFYGTILFIIGIILYLYSKEDDETLKNSSSAFLLFAIILIPLNFISSILLFVNNSSIQESQRIYNPNGPPIRIKRVIDPEYKKVDILLKIGVGMVFISGILFATNSWEFISDILKVIILIVLGGLFLCLSIFTERKLKLYRSSYMYWILSMSFFLLSIVSTLYFGIFSEKLVYVGDARALSYFITFFAISGLSIATYLKFPKKYLLYLTYASVLLAIVNIVRYFIPEHAVITTIISILAGGIILASDKETTLSNFMRIVAFSLFPFILFDSISDPIIIYISGIANIILLAIINNKYKDSIESVISLFITYTLIIFTSCRLENVEIGLVIFLLTTIYTLLIKFSCIKVNNAYHNVNYILYLLINLIIMPNYDNAVYSLITSITCLIVNYLETQDTKELPKIAYAKYLEPILVYATIMNILSLDIFKETIETNVKTIITSIVFCIFHYLNKDKNMKLIYFIAIILLTLLSIEDTVIYEQKEVLASILALLPGAYLYYSQSEESVPKHVISFIFHIYTIYSAICISNIFKLDIFICIAFVILTLAAYICLSKRNHIQTTSYFLIVLPLIRLLSETAFTEDIKSIILSIIALYITLLIIKFFTKEADSKNIIGIIGVVVSMLLVLETQTNITGIYIGIVGLIVIIIGYNSKELKSFFTLGIIITILNILYQLRNLWEQIPFWLYLLVGGLSLIGFVTYKEVTKNNKK